MPSMSRRTTPSSDDFREDLDFHQLTWENELAREQARQQRRRQAGVKRDLSERLEGHTTPLSVGILRSPLVTPTGVRDALQRAMDLSGIATAPPARVGVAPNVSSPSSACSARRPSGPLPRTCRPPRLVPDKSMSWNGFFETSCPKIKLIPCWTRWGSTTTNWPIISPSVHRRRR